MLKTLLVLAVLFPRPPEPVIPFTYDPNMITSEVLRTHVTEPNNAIFYIPLKAYEPEGQGVILTVNDPNVWIPAPTTISDPNDPNAVIHKWRCDIRVGTVERIIYLEFTATDNDPNPATDRRMVLINVRKKKVNRPPVLGWDG